MKLLIVGRYSAFWHEPAFERAFSDLGYTVKRFAFLPYIQKYSGLIQYVQERLLVGPLIRTVNKDFLEMALREAPDVIIFYRSLFLEPDIIAELKAALKRTVFVTYFNDNMFGRLRSKVYWRFFRRSLPLYDLNFVYRRSCQHHYEQIGAGLTYVLYPYYLPWLHTYDPAATKDVDIGFYGHCEPDDRIDYLSHLVRSLSARYELRGSNWHKWQSNVPWQGWDTQEVQNEQYVGYINRTRILLAFYSTWNEDTYTRRCFEIPACRGFMLCRRSDDMLTFYEEDKEAVYFSTPEELTDKAKFYLQHPEARERIAQAGYERCLHSGYDIYSRLREVIARIEEHRQ